MSHHTPNHGFHPPDEATPARPALSGSFVVEERGTFVGRGDVRCAFEVVPDTGTAELGGLRGGGAYTAVHGEPSVSYTFEYTLP